MNKYIIRVEDRDDRSRSGVYYYAAETEKTLEEVIETFEQEQKEWNNEDNPHDCLMCCIEEKMAEKGINFYQLNVDKTMVI